MFPKSSGFKYSIPKRLLLHKQMAIFRFEFGEVTLGYFCAYRIIRLDVYVPDRSVERRRVMRYLVPVNRPVRIVVHRKDLRMWVLPTIVDTDKTHQVTL